MSKIVTITIDPDNPEVEVDLDGYQGKGCHAVQEAFQKAFGGESRKTVRKAEYHKPVTKNVNVNATH